MRMIRKGQFAISGADARSFADQFYALACKSVRNDLDNALQGKFRRLINNATQSLPIRRLACLLV